MQARYSHHHLHVGDLNAHRRFWVDGLGGILGDRLGGSDTVRLSGALVLLDAMPNSGGTKGTTVNHLGFQSLTFVKQAVA